MKKRAIVYCENLFGKWDGKTANGLIQESGHYEIVSVIDSSKSGIDSGDFLLGKQNGIPISKDLDHALSHSKEKVDDFIFGIAPADAFLKREERYIIQMAMKAGMNIVNPLQELLTEDEEMVELANKYGVNIYDIRKPRPRKEWTIFTGQILDLKTPVLTVLGTDGACGKRTTAMVIEKEMNRRGYHTTFIATGQTGLIQGAKYGFAMDAFPLQFMIGELEREILRSNKAENPDFIIVEGQGALSHPAYASSSGILKGARPQAVILQHPPKREYLSDFPFIKTPSVKSEIELIEHFAQTKVIGITLNHEEMNEQEIEATINEYEQVFQLPTTDVLKKGADKIVDRIIEYFFSK